MWPFLPLGTFLSVGLLCFGFRCHFLPLHPHSLWCRTTPPTPLTFFILPSPALSLLPSVVWEERAVPEASAAWPPGGAAAEAHSIPSVVAEHGKEVSDGGRDQRPAECCRDSGHIYMWADNTTTDSCEIDRNHDADSLSRCIVAGLICDLVYSVTVVKLDSARWHQSYNDRQFSLVRCVWSAGK